MIVRPRLTFLTALNPTPTGNFHLVGGGTTNFRLGEAWVSILHMFLLLYCRVLLPIQCWERPKCPKISPGALGTPDCLIFL